MDPGAPRYARVVVDVAPAHLDHPFDYLVPEGLAVRVGARVRVAFAGRRRAGWVVEVTAEPATDPAKVRPLAGVDGPTVWFDERDLRLYRWVADRYAGSLADVLRHALPARVARVEAEAAAWPAPAPCVEDPRRSGGGSSTQGAGRLRSGAARSQAVFWRPPPGDDVAALTAERCARTLAAGRSVLLLVPDPSSALPDRVLHAAGAAAADLRGDVTAAERYRAFLRGRAGHVRLVVGERSAVFAPLRDLGLVIVDDEANPAYKERRSPRHHTREVALARARMAGAACVLIGDLPSAASWRHRSAGLLDLVEADRSAQRARLPHIEVVDRAEPRPGAHRGRLSDRTSRALGAVVDAGGTALVLAARKGEGAVLACRGCGRRLACAVCNGSLATAVGGTRRCGGCGWTGEAVPCADCGDDRTAPLAAGAGRLAQELARSYPQAQVVRMEGFDAPGPSRRPAIAVMTRGSVVAAPAWLQGEPADLAVVVDADGMLRRGTLDAAEDALRLWLAVTRISRRVVVQTRERGHPAIQALVRRDPDGFWEREVERRAELRYPPAGWLVRVAAPPGEGDQIADELRAHLPPSDEVLGPSTGGAVLVKSAALRGTLAALTPLRHQWGYAGRKARVDVDPATTE